MPWIDKHINNWQHLIELLSTPVQTGADDAPTFIYRGQENATWSLPPSFMREFQTSKLKVHEALQIEQQAYFRFMSQAHLHVKEGLLAPPFPPPQGSPIPVFEIWSLT